MGWKYEVVASVTPLGWSLNMPENIFLQSFSKGKKQTSYTLLLETRSLLIKIMTMERVIEHMVKDKKTPKDTISKNNCSN